MTEEAVKVWRDAVYAYGGLSIPGENERSAAAVIAAAMAADKARIAKLTLERDGARKAMGLFMSAPDMPPGVLQWVQFQMGRYKPEDTSHAE